jgi:hypothetical protein
MDFRLIVIIGVLGMAAMVAAVFSNPTGDFWHAVEPPKAQVEAYNPARLASAIKLDSAVYDPIRLNRLVREPQNTLSNLAYILVGLIVAIRSSQAASRIFALACVFLGAGSAAYHASLLPEWRLLDILGVYTALFLLGPVNTNPA